MKRYASYLPLIFSFVYALYPVAASAGQGVYQRVDSAFRVLYELNATPEKGIPHDLLSSCAGIAIFPGVIKGGFILGANYGEGILVVRDQKTNKWKGPTFLTMGGGSFGWQIGLESVDFVMVIMNERGVRAFLSNNATLGVDLSVAAGPVGRKLEAATDASLKAEVYSYSRARGFFAGVSLQGVYIYNDYDANQAFYLHPYLPSEILYGDIPKVPEEAQRLLTYLERFH
ncbi:lipid-binding SYLF domain-containing protein [Dissulfurimicrobium hydrothermale]|uniref:lipid-binding SYLF domain-containing protein n=1 Tax=Dissulfurimicrobium hydrothermale TaxID=1750598 RepID=UPI001ED9E371|nr:lipid-binding SYLF domain-containing protein [Dissulfurimicrobium hydrothermale]UKL13292.1 lipid-binding SYLF domain-containing protein [Dissulfurimicrobium hydrothermale]